MSPPLILASQSPRRRELLAAAGFEFSVDPPRDSTESICSGESPADAVARLALKKARDVANRSDAGIVIGCDTVAECQGTILGKPVDRDHAFAMLSMMRGRQHRVLSGLCLWYRPSNVIRAGVDVSHLTMANISDEQLEAYLDTEQWIGKAGAFGFQDELGWINLDRGSESNVVGLPMELFRRLLEEILTEVGNER